MSTTLALVEQRSYVLLPGQVPAYLKLYEAEGYRVQAEVLEHLLGYYSVEAGPLNTVIHLWGFTSHADREARRARLQASMAWQAYWASVRGLIVSQQSIFLKPAPFFVARLQSFAAAGAPALPTP